MATVCDRCYSKKKETTPPTHRVGVVTSPDNALNRLNQGLSGHQAQQVHVDGVKGLDLCGNCAKAFDVLVRDFGRGV